MIRFESVAHDVCGTTLDHDKEYLLFDGGVE